MVKTRGFSLCGASVKANVTLCGGQPSAGVLLARAAVPLVGPCVGHGEGRVGTAAGERWRENASSGERGQRVGGQQEGAARGGVGGKGKCALHAGVPGQRRSFG